MKQFVLVCLMVLVGVLGWRFGSTLSSDAVSMGIGVLFGVMAGVPAALLVLASARRRSADPDDDESAGARRGQYGGYGQPPVIVVTGAPQAPHSAQNPYMLNPPASMAGMPHDVSHEAREFKVVGEREEWIDEY